MAKILLLGDYSALHKNLKEGLVALGHDVTLASSGDDWKNLARDIDLNYKNRKNKFLPRKIVNIIYPLIDLKQFKGFDVVQLINPLMFFNKRFPNKFHINQLLKNNSKTFILAAGDDAYFWKFSRKELKYGPFDDTLKYDYNKKSHMCELPRVFNLNKYIVDKCDGIIPIMYEYEVGYKNHTKLKNTIPIPMNIDKIKYKENIIGEKLVVFHGLNRPGFKGTMYVEKAFEILKGRYPDELELVIDGHMPLDEYLQFLERVNVVIDQTSSHSLGVNGVYSLAMGKVVLGGAEPESLISHNVTSSPVINILPNPESIVKAIEELLINKNEIPTLGLESRKYAENVHGHINIAKQYLKTWGLE